MTAILLPLLMSFVAFVTGWVACDYKRWSREYDAWQFAQARRRSLRVVRGGDAA